MAREPSNWKLTIRVEDNCLVYAFADGRTIRDESDDAAEASRLIKDIFDDIPGAVSMTIADFIALVERRRTKSQ